ncbi:MAG: hypothetical protein FJY97_17060 [candidate division Zixibacteria bacterium]|nr:hypothetical protein [candidate division Zixibacteria bacterium]
MPIHSATQTSGNGRKGYRPFPYIKGGWTMSVTAETPISLLEWFKTLYDQHREEI